MMSAREERPQQQDVDAVGGRRGRDASQPADGCDVQPAARRSRAERPQELRTTTKDRCEWFVRTTCNAHHQPIDVTDALVTAMNAEWDTRFKRAHVTSFEASALREMMGAATISCQPSVQTVVGLLSIDSNPDVWTASAVGNPLGLFASTAELEEHLFSTGSSAVRNIVDLARSPRGPLLVRLVFPTEQACAEWRSRERTFSQPSDHDGRRRLLCDPFVELAFETLWGMPNSRGVVVVSGASGVGKTFSAIASGHTIAGIDDDHDSAADTDDTAIGPNRPAAVVGVVVLLRRCDFLEEEAAWNEDDPRWNPENKSVFKETERDRSAVHVVASTLESMMGRWLPRPTDGSLTVPRGTVTLVLDELECAPNLVRAVISASAEIEFVVKRLTCAAAARIVVIGTGTSGVPLLPGSLGTAYTSWMPKPCSVWSAMVGASSLPEPVKALLGGEESGTEASNAVAICRSNTRMAALMLRALSNVCDKRTALTAASWGQNIATATSAAIADFNTLNSLGDVPVAHYMVTVADALATAYYKDIRIPSVRDAVMVKHGLVWDVAERGMQDAEDGLSSSEGVIVPCRYGGQRYWVSRANVLMAEIVTNTGMRHRAGAGRAAFVADWLTWSLAMVRQAARLNSVPGFAIKVGDMHRPAARGWTTPAAFQFERFLQPAVPQSVPAKILAVKLASPVTATSTTGEVLAALPPHAHDATADIVAVNADKSPFADIIVLRRSTKELLLVQVKRYTSTQLSVETVNAELHKMGCASAERSRDHLIALLRERLPKPSDNTTAPGNGNRSRFDHWVSCVYDMIAGSMISAASGDLESGVKKALAAAGHWKALKACLNEFNVSFAVAKNSLAGLKATVSPIENVTVHFVIVDHGVSPEAFPGPLAPNVHLVHSMVNTSAGEEEQGLRLTKGLYPIGLPTERPFVAEIATCRRLCG